MFKFSNSTKIRIVISIVLSLLFLVMIGRKKREEFNNMNTSINGSINNQRVVYGNRNPLEYSENESSILGNKINLNDDNNLSNLELKNIKERNSEESCNMSNKSTNDQERIITENMLNAQAKLKALIKEKNINVGTLNHDTICA